PRTRHSPAHRTAGYVAPSHHSDGPHDRERCRAAGGGPCLFGRRAMKPFRLGIAGTGTEVGKTTLGARLAAGLRAAGYPVLAAKPIETGYLDPEQSDAAKLAEAAGHAFVAPALTSAEPVGPLRADLGPRGPVDVSTLSAW